MRKSKKFILIMTLSAAAGFFSPDAFASKELFFLGHGSRLLPGATTDLWVHRDFAYLGTFNQPCGDGTGDNGSGIRIFDVSDPRVPREIAPIPSLPGSRINDIKVGDMNSSQILVHSNEPCNGGQGGFEIWNVDDPLRPFHLAHVQTDDINSFIREEMGGKDIGVHNLFLFQQGNRDFVASVVESLFGNFQIFDITDPRNPSPVGFWGVEELRLAELGLSPDLVVNLRDPELIADLQGFLESGFGQFPRRFLHDITISQRGDLAYLSYWDAGVVLLDIRDPSNPVFLSAAVDPGSDGEVNSHAAWPNEDGSIVVETSEDFDAFTTTGLPEKWGGVRIWDFRDPLQPILLSTFETFCSANPGDTSCDPRGVYSVHNVMVKGTLAFLSWYGNGVLVLDISDPRNPFEVARFNPVGPDFEASNGGIQDVWGIFFDKGRGFASDRNGGLYIFNLKGSQ